MRVAACAMARCSGVCTGMTTEAAKSVVRRAMMTLESAITCSGRTVHVHHCTCTTAPNCTTVRALCTTASALPVHLVADQHERDLALRSELHAVDALVIDAVQPQPRLDLDAERRHAVDVWHGREGVKVDLFRGRHLGRRTGDRGLNTCPVLQR